MSGSSTIGVQVRLNGVLAARLGARPAIVLSAPATVADLVRELGAEGLGCAIHLDGRIVSPSEPLADGAEVAVLVPHAGG